jgi:hypothetical protein
MEIIDMTHGSCTLRLALATLAAAISVAATAAAPAAENVFSATDGWARIADGVYQRQQADGTVTRFAYGSGGAAFERARLEGDLARMQAQFPADADGERALERRIDGVRAALAAIPEKAGGGISPMSTSSGLICNRWQYDFDTHLVVGAAGATAVSRVVLTPDPSGTTMQPPPSAVSQSTEAEVTGFGSFISSSNSGITYRNATSTAADSPGVNLSGPVGPTACTAHTESQIHVTPGVPCAGQLPFVSTSTDYNNCTTSP